ncbi:MAG: hypothetical protein HFE90_01825 [Firmicutes bacterium]|nr:hypothetical protein [Bacillota bacterium]
MRTIKILLIDKDGDFRKKFSDYMVGNYEDIIITVLEGRDKDINTIKNMFFENDIVFADERAWTPTFVPEGYKGICVVMVGEHYGKFSEQPDKNININCIFAYKFQSIPDILRMIPEFKMGTGRKISGGSRDSSMELIAVSGFSGGCGKTSFAVMLARLNQSRFKRRTLIISLESISDINDYFVQVNGNIDGQFFGEEVNVHKTEDMNILILNFLAGISVNMKDFVVKDRFGVSTFILPRSFMNDIVDLGEKHIGEFLVYIEKLNLFDTVIFDMDNRLSAGNAFVYKKADRVFSLCREDRLKIGSEVVWEEKVIEHCKDRSIIKVMNFCGEVSRADSIVAEDDVYIKKESDFMLPFDPNSFFVKDGGFDISMVGEYAAAVGYLVNEVMVV